MNCLIQQPEQAISVVFFLLALPLPLPCLGTESRSRSLGDTQFSLENPLPTPWTPALSFSHTITCWIRQSTISQAASPVHLAWRSSPFQEPARRVGTKSKTATFMWCWGLGAGGWACRATIYNNYYPRYGALRVVGSSRMRDAPYIEISIKTAMKVFLKLCRA